MVTSTILFLTVCLLFWVLQGKRGCTRSLGLLQLNPFMLAANKIEDGLSWEYLPHKTVLWKILSGETIIRNTLTTLVQIFSLRYSKDISISIKDADDTWPGEYSAWTGYEPMTRKRRFLARYGTTGFPCIHYLKSKILDESRKKCRFKVGLLIINTSAYRPMAAGVQRAELPRFPLIKYPENSHFSLKSFS